MGRLADRRGPVLPATAGLAIQVGGLAIYAQLPVTNGLWVVVLASGRLVFGNTKWRTVHGSLT